MKFIYIFLALIFLAGCKNSPSNNSNTSYINLEQAIERSPNNIPLSILADSVSYIKLETNDSCILGKVREVCFDDSLIFLSDGMYVYNFDITGKFIRQIGSTGRGPEEYIKVGSLAIDKYEKSVYVLDRYQKSLFTFDYNGKLKNRNKLESYENLLGVIDSVYIAAMIRKANVIENENYQINILTKDFNTVNKVLDYSKFEIPHYAICGAAFHFYYNNGILTFWDYLGNTVYRIKDNLNISLQYVFDLGKHQPPYKLLCGETDSRKSREIQDKLHDYFRIINVLDTDQHIFIYGFFNRKRQYLVIDKSNFRIVKPTIDWMIFNQGLFNDIDGGLPFWPIGSKDSGIIYQVIEPIQIKSVLNHPLYKEYKIKHPNLKINSKEIDDSSNPWIMMVYLKSKV